MFEYLPTITDDNLNTVVEKEIDYFQDLLGRCVKETETPNEAIDCICSELSQSNPNLVRAIRGAAYSVFGELEDDCSLDVAWTGALATVAGVLVALRLVDRALQAKQMEAQIASLKEG